MKKMGITTFSRSIGLSEAVVYKAFKELGWSRPENYNDLSSEQIEVIKSTKCAETYLSNKAKKEAREKEWHWIKDGDFPEEEKEYLIYTKKKKLEIRKIHISGDGKNYLTDVFLMRDLESVIAWKEIVPPKLKESEL